MNSGIITQNQIDHVLRLTAAKSQQVSQKSLKTSQKVDTLLFIFGLFSAKFVAVYWLYEQSVPKEWNFPNQSRKIVKFDVKLSPWRLFASSKLIFSLKICILQLSFQYISALWEN